MRPEVRTSRRLTNFMPQSKIASILNKEMVPLSWMQPSVSLDHESKKKYLNLTRVAQIVIAFITFAIVAASSASSYQAYLGFLSANARQVVIATSTRINPLQPLLVPALAALFSLFETFARGLNTWKWKAIQSSLDEFSDQVFSGSNHQKDLNHKHRVTLFRLQAGCPRMLKPVWEKWLVPVARSGIITKRTRSIFRLNDNKHMIEGVVVKAFLARKGAWEWIEDVPSPSTMMPASDRQSYRDKTNIDVDKALRMGYDARSYAAVRMEVSGKPWGVLVLDSTDSKLPSHKTVNKLFRILASAIGPVLEAL